MTPQQIFTARTEAEQHFRANAFDKAAALLTELVVHNPYDGELRAWLMHCASQLGQAEQAIALAEEALQLGCKFPERICYETAKLCATLQRKEACLAWLEKALQARWPDRPDIINEEVFKPYHYDPRFIRLSGVLTEPPADRNSGWQLDLDYLLAEVQRLHVGFERPAFSDNFLSQAAELRQRMPALEDAQIVVEMQRLVALLGDGHSWVYPYPSEKVSLTMLPLDFYRFSDGLFIIGAQDELSRWIGGQILKFGPKPVDDVLDAIAAYISADNPIGKQRRAVPFLLKIPAFLQAIGATTDLNVVTLTIRDRHGISHELALSGGPFRDVPNLWPSLISETAAPLYLQNTRRNYWLQQLNEAGAIYLQYNQVRDMADQTIEDFASHLLALIRETGVNNLIIDVRHNSGGNNFLSWPLVRALVHFETDAPDHRLFVLIGRQTFSACQNFVNWLDRLTRAIFIGEPTGSKPNFVGESTNLTLPYSRIQGSISSRIHFDSFWGDERQWLAPHIPIELSSVDYFANRDPVLQAALAIVTDVEA